MFVGRKEELNLLDKKINSKSFEFGIICGRKRIGKTRILQEVITKHEAIYYVANEMGLEYNLKQLSLAIATYFKEPISFSDLNSAFLYLAKRSENQKIHPYLMNLHLGVQT